MVIKRVRYILVALIFVLVVISGMLLTRMLKEYPGLSGYYAAGQMSCVADEGLYFVKNLNYIYFLDRETGQGLPACNKEFCSHNSMECDAYIEGTVPPGIMYYNGKLYIMSYYCNIYFDEDKKMLVTEECSKIYEMSTNGEDKRILYECDSGGVWSAYAKGDKLLFTVGKNRIKEKQGSCSVEESYTDGYLYSYDLRWRKLKEIHSMVETDSCQSLFCSLINTDGDWALYHEFYVDKDGKKHSELYQIDDDQFVNRISFFDTSRICQLYEANGIMYHIFIDSKNKSKTLSILDDAYNVKRKVLSIYGDETCLVGIGKEYVALYKTDYQKALYDLRTGTLYVANNYFTETGKYVSDIVAIDPIEDTIYIDSHDYTGMVEGDTYYEDLKEMGAMSLTSFVRLNYVIYDQLSDDQKALIDWITIYEY